MTPFKKSLFCLIMITLAYLPLPALAANADPQAITAVLQKAIDEKNSALAMRHINLESIVDTMVRTQLPRINEAVLQGKIQLNQQLFMALAAINSGNASTKRTTVLFLSAELGKFIIYGIDSGSFAGSPIPENRRAMMDSGIFGQLEGISMQRKEFSAARILSQDNGEALTSASLYDFGTKTSYPLELALQKSENLWKVTSINNLDALLATAGRQKSSHN